MSTRNPKVRGFESILCAVDFSLGSVAALQHAVAIALNSGGTVTALCVEDPLLGQGAAAVGYNTSLLRQTTLAQLKLLMGRVASPAGLPPERWSVETVLGRPATATVAYARRIRADLIVMGTHSRRGPAKLFFGSTAEGVLRRAPAAVLVVPPRRPAQVDQRHLARPIVGAIDLGPHTAGDARRMVRVARWLGAPLTLLHVVSETPAPSWFATRLKMRDRKRLLAARARLRSIAGIVKSGSRVLLGHPPDEIVATALDVQAGLIILALRRGHGIFGARQGTTTYRVLCGSRTPVLALGPAASEGAED